MKKTISLLALTISASTATHAIVGPPYGEVRKYCLSTYTDVSGGRSVGDCDETANNNSLRLRLGPNGCTHDQVLLQTTKSPFEREFPIRIEPCLPPNITQL